jgi:hypothetical protein
MPIETRRSCLMKKTGHEKSRDTVPLRENFTIKVPWIATQGHTFRNLYIYICIELRLGTMIVSLSKRGPLLNWARCTVTSYDVKFTEV